MCRQAVSMAPNALQGSYPPTPAQEKISFTDFFFFFPIWQLSFATLPRREQNLMFSLCYRISREGCVEVGAASSHSCIWDYILPSTRQSFSTLYSTFNSPSLPVELGLLVSWLLRFLSLLLSTQLQPRITGAIIVLQCLMSSTVKQSIETMK